jgi:hypothetical protein
MSKLDKIYGTKKGGEAIIENIVSVENKVYNQIGNYIDYFSNFDWTTGANTTYTIAKAIVDLPVDIKQTFQKAINFTATLTGYSFLGLKTKVKYTASKNGKIKASYWIQVHPVAITYNNQIGMVFRWIRGVNNTAVKTITTGIQGNQIVGTIVPTINAGNVYTVTNATNTVRVLDYLKINTTYYLNIEIEITENTIQSDYITVDFNCLNSNFSNGETPNLLMWGLQIVDFDELTYNKIQLPYASKLEHYYLERGYTSELDNKISDLLLGGGRVTFAGGSPALIHNGILTSEQTDVTTALSDDVRFFKKYTISKNTGNLAKWVSASVRNTFLRFVAPSLATTSEKNAMCLGFWIKRSDLSGNGIIVSTPSGGVWEIIQSDMMCEGFIESAYAGANSLDAVYIDAVKDDYSYIKIKFDSTITPTWEMRISILNKSTNEIQSITLYNPTLIYSNDINPFYFYKSKSEKLESDYRGKKALIIGDSEYNDATVAVRLSERLGMNIADHHQGGHMMAIRTNLLEQTHYSSFYHVDLRNAMLDEPNVDIYILTASSNDGNGGGTATTASVQAVYDNYPVYGDDAATISAKMALFNALSQAERDEIFLFQHTYGAYIKQILTVNPDAKILLCTVPISVGAYLSGAEVDGKGVWAVNRSPEVAKDNLGYIFDNINEDIEQLSARYNTYKCDSNRKCGLTWWNFTNYCIDGTHWFNAIDENIALAIEGEVRNIKVL